MKYRIEQYELHSQTYEIEANSPAEAIKKLFDGEAESNGDGPEYIHVHEDMGRSLNDFDLDLREELDAYDIETEVNPVTGDVFVPSIRSIQEIR